MTTFAGDYVQEPSDFATVATEAALIQIADDPSTPVIPDSVVAFSLLDAPQKAAVVAVIDEIVKRKEGVINGYLRAGGYAIPVDVDANAIILDYAVRLTWNDLRYRKGQLNDDELTTANDFIFKQLGLIGSGGIVIVADASVEEASSGTVYAIGTSERIMSRETLEDF